MNIAERLVRDVESVDKATRDFDEQALLARVYRTLGIESSGDMSAAGHSDVAGTAGATAEHRGCGCATC
jgi:hypothetical protein